MGRLLGTPVSSGLWSATSGINLYPGQYWTCKHNMGLTFRWYPAVSKSGSQD